MESPKFRLCNRSRESFLSLDITLVDTINETIKSMVSELSLRPDGALWLKPYRGIPVTPGFPAFEIIYLDENLRVLQEVESFPSPSPRPLKYEPDSAIVLSPHTVLASMVRPGDQLAVRTPEEMEVLRSKLAVPSYSLTNHNGSSAASHSDDDIFQHQQTVPWSTRLWHWLVERPRERRHANRYPLPGLVGYHWSGSAPTPELVGNISQTGFFLVTEERPMPGTRILITLQRSGSSGSDPDDVLAVQSRVVRWGPDGVGFQLLPMNTASKRDLIGAQNGADHKSIKRFIKQFATNHPSHITI